MNEKIDWYREVLEIEPQARLFYPLAKLLIEDGRPLEACDVLARGLVHHPAYMEARMCYAELLATLGRDEACREQIDLLSGILSGRAGFWQAWAERAGGDADAGLAMRCLSLVLRGVPVSFSDLMRRGLESLEAEYEQSVPADEAAVSAAACGAAARQAAAIIAAAGAAGHLAPAAPEPEESAAASTARAEAGEPAEESPVSASLAAHLAEHRARLLNEAAPAGPEPEALDEDAAPEAEAGSEELSAGGHLPGFEALSAFTASMDSARDDGEAAGQPEEEQSAEAAALAAKAAAAVARLAAAEEAEAGDAEDSGEAALAEEPAAAMPPESGESGEAEAAEEAGFEAAVACALAQETAAAAAAEESGEAGEAGEADESDEPEDAADDGAAAPARGARSGRLPRTRSMAEVLAEQHEYGRAVKIYRELLATETSESAAAGIRARLAELKKLADAKAPVKPETEQASRTSQVLAGVAPAAKRESRPARARAKTRSSSAKGGAANPEPVLLTEQVLEAADPGPVLPAGPAPAPEAPAKGSRPASAVRLDGGKGGSAMTNGQVAAFLDALARKVEARANARRPRS